MNINLMCQTKRKKRNGHLERRSREPARRTLSHTDPSSRIQPAGTLFPPGASATSRYCHRSRVRPPPPYTPRRPQPGLLSIALKPQQRSLWRKQAPRKQAEKSRSGLRLQSNLIMPFPSRPGKTCLRMAGGGGAGEAQAHNDPSPSSCCHRYSPSRRDRLTWGQREELPSPRLPQAGSTPILGLELTALR